MPRNGTGQYIAPASSWNPGVNGVTAQTADFNALLDDLEAGLTQSVSSDGQTPMTGNLPMGNNRITGLANGVAVTDAAALGQVVRNIGQCRLTKSGSNLLLSPYQGNQLAINGALYTIPSAGVTLAPGSVTPSTLYYIYAYMVGTTMTLEASTTGHSTDINTGVEIKTGDSTRTLVGMARPITGPLWQDAANQRFVVSWFNRPTVTLTAAFTANRGISSVGYGEMNSEIRNEFLVWAGQGVQITASGSVSNGTAAFMNAAIGVDSSSTAQDSFASGNVAVNGQFPIGQSLPISTLAEGYHFATLLGSTSTGTAVFLGSATPGVRCTVGSTIPGGA